MNSMVTLPRLDESAPFIVALILSKYYLVLHVWVAQGGLWNYCSTSIECTYNYDVSVIYFASSDVYTYT